MAIDETVFKALADGSRRQLLDALNERNGQSLRDLCAGLDMARQSVSKHLALLEAADLVTTTRRGREKLHYLNAAPINAIADRWINQFDRGRVQAMADLTASLEAPMSETKFTYTTYIKTTPEKAWQALTDPEFTRRYWGAQSSSPTGRSVPRSSTPITASPSPTPSRSCLSPSPVVASPTPGTR
jgi:DNA-binding transcriptional ArsR family regulator